MWFFSKQFMSSKCGFLRVKRINLSPLLKASATFQQHLGAVGFAWFPGVFIPIICHHINLPRWWFLKYVLFSPLLGEMILFDYFFGMGWNHQLGWICMIPGVCIICHHINLPFAENVFPVFFHCKRGSMIPRTEKFYPRRRSLQITKSTSRRWKTWGLTNDQWWRMADGQFPDTCIYRKSLGTCERKWAPKR